MQDFGVSGEKAKAAESDLRQALKALFKVGRKSMAEREFLRRAAIRAIDVLGNYILDF